MALNDVTFVKGQGGLGRPLPGEDYISGILFYRASLPSGFDSANRIKQVFSIQDAEALGILLNYADETPPTATYQVTTPGTTGDVISFYVQDIYNNVLIGSYTKASGDTTATLVATGIKNAINTGTLTHGYSATSATDTVTITAKAGLGVFLNSGSPLTAVISSGGTIAGTLTQFSAGVASLIAPMWYHISEYFRIQPKGNLYVGIFDIPGSYTFVEVETMQNFANGIIRQIAVYADAVSFSTTNINSLQAVATTLDGLHMPLSILYAANLVGTALTALTDLNLLSDNKVSAVIGQDGIAQGYALFKAYGKSITCLGAVLGAVSFASVSDDIAWVAKFNLGLGIELNVAAFAEGTLFRAASSGLISQLNSYRYIFLIKRVGKDGTWANDSHTAILSNSDYAYIENNRTIDKAIRNLDIAYTDLIASPIIFNQDGTLSDTSVATFESTGDQALDQMVRDSELSGKTITVDPTQNSASTSIIAVTVELLGIGVARNINVKIGYVLSL